MKIFSFKILIICILLPPVLYLLTVSSLENYLHNKYQKEITNIYLSDINNILSGLTNIKDSIDTSINQYLTTNFFLKMGGRLDVNVTTKQGNILYPATYQNTAFDKFSTNTALLAEKNFELLNEGIDINVNVKIRHYSLIAIILLLFYVLTFLGGLYGYFRRISAKIQLDELTKKEELKRLHELEEQRLEQIGLLSQERELLLSEYDQLKTTFRIERSQAEKTEEDLFEEIGILENKLKEIGDLKTRIAELEKNKNLMIRQKQKAVEKLEKRFKTLYKKITITDRALGALADMPDDMGLKAEEVIQQLNNDPSLVSVKRKVFTKKGKITSFEVVFSYNGRLYFRKISGNRIEIPVIGTKNSQEKDMTLLDKLV